MLRRARVNAHAGGQVLCAGALNASLLDFLGGGRLNDESLRVGRLGLLRGCVLLGCSRRSCSGCKLLSGFFGCGLLSALFRGLLDRLLPSLLDCVLSCNPLSHRLVGGRCSHATGQCHGYVRFAGLARNLDGLVDPLGHGGEYIRVQGVEATLPLHGHGDHVCITKDFQVLRNGRLAHAQLFNHSTHRVGLLSENTHNSAASRIRDDRKNIRMHIAIMTYKVALQA